MESRLQGEFSSKLMRADDSIDTMQRREEFAVSLRKKKKRQIIEEKRKRLPSSIAKMMQA